MSPASNPLRYWPHIAILGGLVLLGGQMCRISDLRSQVTAAALRADSLEAAGDTTRSLTGRALAVLGDSLSGVERRVVQEKQRADALDLALRRERIARVSADLTVAPVEMEVEADSFDVRQASFTGYKEPYLVEAQVMIPPEPSIPTMRFRIQLDPIPVEVRLGCGPANAAGIRPASVTMLTPSWAELMVRTATQDPKLCASPALQPKQKPRWPWLVAGFALGVVGWELVR